MSAPISYTKPAIKLPPGLEAGFALHRLAAAFPSLEESSRKRVTVTPLRKLVVRAAASPKLAWFGPALWLGLALTTGLQELTKSRPKYPPAPGHSERYSRTLLRSLKIRSYCSLGGRLPTASAEPFSPQRGTGGHGRAPPARAPAEGPASGPARRKRRSPEGSRERWERRDNSPRVSLGALLRETCCGHSKEGRSSSGTSPRLQLPLPRLPPRFLPRKSVCLGLAHTWG